MATEAIGIHHVAVTATNFDVSKKFYDRLLGHLGMAPAIQATGYPHKDTEGRMCIYAGKAGLFALWEADAAMRSNKFQVYNVGLHHLAFAAPSREAVEELHQKLVADGVKILNPPKEYGYVPGFYAVFFEDPDGMKLEFAFTPRG